MLEIRSAVRVLRVLANAFLAATLNLIVVSPAAAWVYTLPRADKDIGHDAAYAAAIDDAGNKIAAVGRLEYPDISFSPPAFTVVTLSSDIGTQVWWQEVRGARKGPLDRALATAFDPFGDVIAVGVLEREPQGRDFVVVKLSADTGEELWRYVLTNPSCNSCVGRSVAMDPNGDVIAGGSSYVVKLSNASGTELWRRELTGAVYSVALDPAGDVVVAAQTKHEGAHPGFGIVKVSGTTGQVLWSHEVDPGGALGVATDAAGDIVAVGTLYEGSWWDGTQAVAVKLAGTTGQELWRTVLSDGGMAVSVAVDGAGHAVATTKSSVVKFDGPTGAVLWQTALVSDCVLISCVSSVAIDSGGNVVAGGDFHGFGVVKLSGPSGAELWRQVLGPYGKANAVVTDRVGDVVAAGTARKRFLVVKLSGASGTVLQPRAGRFVVIRDHAVKQSKRKIRLSLRATRRSNPNGPLWLPATDSAGAPTRVGAVLRVVNPTTGESATFSLPAAYWKARESRKGISYAYRDRDGTNGPCTSAKLNEIRGIQASCEGTRGTIPFTLDEPAQEEVAVALRIGSPETASESQFCAHFGGTVIKDYGTGNPGPSGIFKAKDAPATGTPCP